MNISVKMRGRRREGDIPWTLPNTSNLKLCGMCGIASDEERRGEERQF